MAKVYTIPVIPAKRPTKSRSATQPTASDPYIEGQRLLVEAMKYLAKSDRSANKPAIQLLSEHFRTRFRMSDRP